MNRAWLGLLLGLFAVLPAHGAEPLAERVQALLEDLKSDDVPRRTAAVQTFRGLGVAAVPHTIATLGDLAEARWPGFLDAFEAVGVERALAAILARRSAWPPGAERNGRVHAFLDALRTRRAPERTSRIVLDPVRFEAWPRIPPWAETRIGTELPKRLAGGLYVVERNRRHLAVDTKGDGRPDTKVKVRKGRRLEFGPKGERRPLLVYEKLDVWFVASASVLAGRVKKARVELLDVDLDGRFDGKADAVRWDEGAFRTYVPDRLARTQAGLLRYRVEQGPEGVAVVASVEPMPEDATDPLRGTVAWLNGWRNGIGLPGLLLDLPRAQDCRLHCEYWRKNGYSGHEEVPGRAGYTQQGAHAGQQASVWGTPSMVTLLQWAASTVLHRITLVGGVPIGMAGAQGPGACVWTDRPRTALLGAPVLVPAPGQEGVPLTCNPENPPPDRIPTFYRSKRGYPIAAYFTHGEHVFEGGTLELFTVGRKSEAVAGEVFTPQAPYAQFIPTNYHAIQFVADMPLASKQRYAVRVRAAFRGGPEQVLVWTFSTQ